jgi:hypothetical protein
MDDAPKKSAKTPILDRRQFLAATGSAATIG